MIPLFDLHSRNEPVERDALQPGNFYFAVGWLLAKLYEHGTGPKIRPGLISPDLHARWRQRPGYRERVLRWKSSGCAGLRGVN